MNIVFAIILLAPKFIHQTAMYFLLNMVPSRFRRKKNIEGKTVLITGAGSGVGRELAIEFSKYSTCVVLLDINKTSLIDTEKMMHRCSRVFLYECDVSDRNTVYQTAEKVKKDAGKVDILVNNAGIVCGKPLLDLPDERIEKTMGVNALAHFWTCKAFLPAMVEDNSGHVVSIVSIAGMIGGAYVTDYCSSKYAALGFAESLRSELAAKSLDGIKVTIVCPAVISTGLFEGVSLSVSKTMTPGYVAHRIVEAVLENREFIMLPQYFYLFVLLKQISSYALCIDCWKMTGDLKFMEKFIGRSKDNRPAKNIANQSTVNGK